MSDGTSDCEFGVWFPARLWCMHGSARGGSSFSCSCALCRGWAQELSGLCSRGHSHSMEQPQHAQLCLCCTTIPHTFYSNALGIVGRKLRGEKIKQNKTLFFFFSQTYETSSHPKFLRDNPVGLKEQKVALLEQLPNRQREQDLTIREPKMFLKLPRLQARIF